MRSQTDVQSLWVLKIFILVYSGLDLQSISNSVFLPSLCPELVWSKLKSLVVGKTHIWILIPFLLYSTVKRREEKILSSIIWHQIWSPCDLHLVSWPLCSEPSHSIPVMQSISGCFRHPCRRHFHSLVPDPEISTGLMFPTSSSSPVGCVTDTLCTLNWETCLKGRAWLAPTCLVAHETHASLPLEAVTVGASLPASPILLPAISLLVYLSLLNINTGQVSEIIK